MLRPVGLKVRFNGSLLAPGMAIVVQTRELSSSFSPKILALSPAIAVQTKECVTSISNFCLWFGHRDTNQGIDVISTPNFCLRFGHHGTN